MADLPQERPEDASLREVDELVYLLDTYRGSDVCFADRPERREGESRKEYVMRVFAHITIQMQDARMVIQMILHHLQAAENDRRRIREVDETFAFWENDGCMDESGSLDHIDEESDQWKEGNNDGDFDETF